HNIAHSRKFRKLWNLIVYIRKSKCTALKKYYQRSLLFNYIVIIFPGLDNLHFQFFSTCSGKYHIGNKSSHSLQGWVVFECFYVVVCHHKSSLLISKFECSFN